MTETKNPVLSTLGWIGQKSGILVGCSGFPIVLNGFNQVMTLTQGDRASDSQKNECEFLPPSKALRGWFQSCFPKRKLV